MSQARTNRVIKIAICGIAGFLTYKLIRKHQRNASEIFQSTIQRKDFKIKCIYTFKECEHEMQLLFLSKPKLVGIDCEWNPQYLKRRDIKVAVIQICTQNTCYIIHCAHWQSLPNSLKNVLKSKKIVKTGVGIKTDAIAIKQSFANVINNNNNNNNNDNQEKQQEEILCNFLDLRYVASFLHSHNSHISGKDYNLKGLTKLFFNQLLIKGENTVQCSNWDVKGRLTNEQIIYAALDSYYSRNLFILIVDSSSSGDNYKNCTCYTNDEINKILISFDKKNSINNWIDVFEDKIDKEFVPPGWLKQYYKSQSSMRKINKAGMDSDVNRNVNIGKNIMKKNKDNKKNKQKQKSKNKNKNKNKVINKKSNNNNGDRIGDNDELKGAMHTLNAQWLMFGPNGKFIARIKRRKAFWYLSHNVAVYIDWKNSQEEKHCIQLTFSPTNYNDTTSKSSYLMYACIVCGVSGIEKELIRHQIVPRCYRKYFSSILEDYLSRDSVVPLCTSCKHIAEIENSKYRKMIENKFSKMMMVKNNNNNNSINVTDEECIKQACKNGKILINMLDNGHMDKLPIKRKIVLEKPIRQYYNLNDKSEKIPYKVLQDSTNLLVEKSDEQVIVTQYLNNDNMLLYQFIAGWRNHFAQTMKAKNMNETWLETGNHRLKHLLQIN